jgi:hypothetical protein
MKELEIEKMEIIEGGEICNTLWKNIWGCDACDQNFLIWAYFDNNCHLTDW